MHIFWLSIYTLFNIGTHAGNMNPGSELKDLKYNTNLKQITLTMQ